MRRALLKFATYCLLIAITHSACAQARFQTSSASSADKLFDDEKYVEARTAYAAAVKLAPKNAALRIGLLRTELRTEVWKDGIKDARAAEAVIPSSADFVGFESLFLMRGAQPDEAIGAADRAIQMSANKESYWALIAQGRSLSWQYKNTEARKALRKAIDLQPATEEAYMFLIGTFNAREAAEEHRVASTLQDLELKHHPRKAPKDQADADKRKADDTKEKTDRINLGKYYDTFEKDPPFVGLTPISEANIHAADAADIAPVSFSFAFERGQGEGGQHDIIIPMLVDGVKVKMLFDTGAGHTFSVGKYAAAKMNLPVLAKSAAQGVNGIEPTKMHRAERVSIGKQSFGNIPVESIDNTIGESEDGLIGGAVFDKYVVTVDFKENVMTLTRGRSAVAPPPLKGDKVVSVPFHNVNGYIYVQVSIDNHKWWTILDTGAQGYGVVSLELARMLAKEREKDATIELKVKGRVGIGISETSYTVLAFEFPIDVGCLVGDRTPYFIQMDTLYGASIIDKLSSDMEYNVAGLLGVGYLGQRCRRFSIDYPNHLLTMEQPDE